MFRFRSPVKREGAERYLLITLVSFACTVVLVRVFLQLTGYPQLGNSVLHIAHVLWGGLFLFVAALLPTIFANRWVYTVGALCGGIGVGLFIDEVGKFITQNNNYFFPFAAPIIYAFFLLTVLIYLQVRRPSRFDSRSELYHALDQVMELIENDLDAAEHAELEAGLKQVIAEPQYTEHARLAEALLAVLNSDTLHFSDAQPNLWQRLMKQVAKFEQRYLNERRYRLLLVIGLAFAGVGAIIELLFFSLALVSPEALEELIRLLFFDNNMLDDPTSILWFLVLTFLSGVVGLMLLIGGGLMFIGKTRLGSEISYLGLLIALTTVNLLLFYFSQFAAVSTTLWEFVLLVGLLRYRKVYLNIGATIQTLNQITEQSVSLAE
jgi:hypothetical protein